MDFFTHLLIGLFGSRLFKQRNTKKAFVIGNIAPDFDVFFSWITFIFPNLVFLSHRALFHSILILPFLIPILFFVLTKLTSTSQKINSKLNLTIAVTYSAWSSGLAGSIIHILLDSLNPEGVLTLYPLSLTKFSFFTMNFIEPFVTIPSTIVILFFGYQYLFKDQKFDTQKFFRYSRSIVLIFIVSISLHTTFQYFTVVNQQSSKTSPGWFFFDRWVLHEGNDTVNVTLVNEFTQQIIQQYSYPKYVFNSSDMSFSDVQKYINEAQLTQEFMTFQFKQNPLHAYSYTINREINASKVIVTINEVMSKAELQFLGLPALPFYDAEIEIVLTATA